MHSLWKTVRQPVNLRKVVGRAYSCTCHVPRDSRFGRYDVDPRAIVLFDGMTEWQHVDDGTAASTHHAHIETWGNDCDGGHGDTYVDLPNPGEEGGWEFVQWMRVVESAVGASDKRGTLTTECDDDGRYSCSWSGQHDEGSHGREVRMCIDPHCAYETSSHFDQYAQLAGY
jgi:hypothetical protein